MANLVSFEDVAAQQGRDPSDYSEQEKVQIGAFIEAISGIIISICGTDFQFHENETTYLDVEWDTNLVIPHGYRPVKRIREVWFSDLTGDEEKVTPVSDWTFLRGHLWRNPTWMPSHLGHNPKVGLRLDYGYKEVPEDIRAVVASEVVRWMVQTPGIKSEKVGDLEVNYGSTSNALSSSGRSLLKKYTDRFRSAKVVRW